MLKGKKKAKQALDDYVKDSERLKSKFEKRLRAMPEKDREDLMDIMKAMG
jgi:formiminotetrahydrofolate cyclodeaminase